MPDALTRARLKHARDTSRLPCSPTLPPDGDTGEIWQRTRLMVEWLLTLLEAGLKPGDAATAKEWERLFGPKDSAVVVLQKLVHLLGQLQMYASRERQAAPEPRLSAEERALVKEWLASSGSHAAHPPAP